MCKLKLRAERHLINLKWKWGVILLDTSFYFQNKRWDSQCLSILLLCMDQKGMMKICTLKCFLFLKICACALSNVDLQCSVAGQWDIFEKPSEKIGSISHAVLLNKA